MSSVRPSWLCRWMLRFVGVGLVLLILGILSPQVDLLSRPLAVEANLQPAPVIVVFSSGIIKDCDPSPGLFSRETYGARLFHQGYSQSGKILLSGVYVKEPLLTMEQCRKRLANRLNLPEDALMIDNEATSTYENVINTRKIMQMNDWERILVVTSKSHMRRVLWTLEKQGIQAYPAIIEDYPGRGTTWLDSSRFLYLRRFLYEYVALVVYKWYGYI